MRTPNPPTTVTIDMTPSGHGDRSVYRTEGDRFGAGRLGMVLFLGSLSMLFGATILGIVAIRLDENAWPRNLPPLPAAVWVSTGLLLVSSITMQWGVVASRRGAVTTTRVAMLCTLGLGVGFLVSQTIAWIDWNQAVQALVERDEAAGLAVTGFHVLTGIHAAHVLGGLIPLGAIAYLVVFAAWQFDRTRGIHYTAMYWHFLDLVWIALVITLVLVL